MLGVGLVLTALALAPVGARAQDAGAQPRDEPTSADLALARGYFEKADEARRNGDFQTAAQHYVTAYKASRESLSGLLFNIGLMYWKQADQVARTGDDAAEAPIRGEAARYFRRFVNAAPAHRSADEANGYLNQYRARAREIESRRVAEAEAARRATESRRMFDIGKARWTKADHHERQGAIEAARVARQMAAVSFRRAIALAPDAPYVAEAKKYMAALEKSGYREHPDDAPSGGPDDAVDGEGVLARWREHGRYTVDTAVCQNILGDKDRSLGTVCGVSVTVGLGYAVHPWFDLRLAGAVGGAPAAYLGVDFRPLRSRIRPLATLGVPVFFNGPRAGARVAVGAEFAVVRVLSASLLIAYERYFTAEPGTPDMDIIPIVGVAARL